MTTTAVVSERSQPEYLTTGTRALDRVLGGGLLVGSMTLLVGEIGVGKSTLATQVAADFSTARMRDVTTNELLPPLNVVYVTTEMRADFVRERAMRMSPRGLGDGFRAMRLDDLSLTLIKIHVPDVLIVDSIVSKQETEVLHIANFCRSSDCACICIMHTNADEFATARLGHLADAVVEVKFHQEQWRTLRSIKNRFGFCGDASIVKTGRGFASAKVAFE